MSGVRGTLKALLNSMHAFNWFKVLVAFALPDDEMNF